MSTVEHLREEVRRESGSMGRCWNRHRAGQRFSEDGEDGAGAAGRLWELRIKVMTWHRE